jgi:ABC-type transport system substrate-binding protein
LSNSYIAQQPYVVSLKKRERRKSENMKFKTIALLMLISLIAVFPTALAINGPKMDVLRHEVIRSPGPARIAMIAGEDDMSPDQIRTSDIEAQKTAGLLVTEDLGFHMGYIAFNIRELSIVNQNRSDRIHGSMDNAEYWPLHDMEFRHALIHSYDQLAIIPPIYGFIVTPVRSLVPPAQSKYYETAVPPHPFNQGSPFDTTVYPAEKSSCAILRAKGYTFVDAGTIGVVDDADYWNCPGNKRMPEMVIYTPLYGDAPTSFEHGAEFISDLANIGLAATVANGQRGLSHLGWDFNEYLDYGVYGTEDSMGGNFDAYMVFHSLGRIPSQLYSFLHSSMDSRVNWGQSNGPGVNDATIDDLVRQVRFSTDTDEIATAAKEVQFMMYDANRTKYPNCDNFTLAFMLLYSRAMFNVFSADLEGVVKSPGYGSDNTWSFFSMYWPSESVGRWADVYGDIGKESILKYINGLPPGSLNPTFASTVYEWNIITPNLDGLTDVNPYNHLDIPWVATEASITEKLNQGPGNNETWMEIDITLRDDVYWADGYKVTADDVKFNLEFFRDYQTINGFEQSLHLQNVTVWDDTHCTVYASESGLSLYYSYVGSALYLPPQIWDTTWASSEDVMNYHPEYVDYGTANMGDGSITGHGPYTADPLGWGLVSKNLFGTGMYVYQTYDTGADESELWANRHYFMTQDAMAALMLDSFWQVGDQNTNGQVNVLDLTYTSLAFGTNIMDGTPPFDPDADYDSNNWVNIGDVSNCAYHLLWQREWP